MRDYTEVTYSDKPFTDYPAKLVAYLIDRMYLQPQDKIIDVGCGRGEYSHAFRHFGILDTYSVDISKIAETYYPGLKVYATVGLVPEDSCDFALAKSIFEHIHNPLMMATQIYKALRKGGRICALVPPISKHFHHFYDDIGHVTPFTAKRLYDLLFIAGFDNVKVSRFYQAPILWQRPWLKPLYVVLSKILPMAIKRHWRDILYLGPMLLGEGIKT